MVINNGHLVDLWLIPLYHCVMAKPKRIKSFTSTDELNAEITRWAGYYRISESELIRNTLDSFVKRCEKQCADNGTLPPPAVPPLPVPQKGKAWIYGLYLDNQCFYVGQTTKLYTREGQHRTKYGADFDFEVLEEVNNHEKLDAEQDWIRHLQAQGHKLDNKWYRGPGRKREGITRDPMMPPWEEPCYICNDGTWHPPKSKNELDKEAEIASLFKGEIAGP
ncbi:G-I-Y Y-I-G endonuclease [Gordonia phage GodonK]|uniref:G-I-Y Y-I-G endonuclease n=1 Tax=Gordonia phage GodonK TaxID=2562192 RepID=A0A4D6E2H8_9CAUD|nr:G-I-Y Y-I-G endonuclease [Gordonia phage GodonK]YP_009821581.1 G-I-Y Y-I-G endonuclease [Gordonia phage GodonK]QBZ72621.1 G-I-Y Y-I-G endonuclease [Gordonia phage GodonK]QBZ72816.1 G-I-Y Y-I-G endonuclease [Gordonia phage GodonK]